MHWLFRALTDRLKAMFIADVATDFEAQLLARAAERKAELLRQAQRYDDEGLKSIAQHVRQQAEGLDIQRPLSSVLPAIDHWREHDAQSAPLLIEPDLVESNAPPIATAPSPKARKKGR